MAVFCETWMDPRVPVESILEASFTVSPQMSKTGFVAPMTSHTRGPMLMPACRDDDGFVDYNVRGATRDWVGQKERSNNQRRLTHKDA